MSTPHFITLTAHTVSMRVNASKIYAYRKANHGSSVVIDGQEVEVTETPEQIDALLGVAGSDIVTAVMQAMDASGIAIEDKGEDYCAGFDNAHAIFYQRVKAAIAKATGAEGGR